MKKKSVTFKTRIGVLSHLPGMHYLEIPKAVVEKLGGKLKLRLICTINGRLKFQCGLMALGQGRAYVSITKKRLKELSVRDGDQVEVHLEPDSSRFGMEVCAELKEVLKQDVEGRKRFDGLTPGKQRYVIHYVGSVKNPDLRVDRAVLLIENLKRLPVGKESFREMLGLPSRRPSRTSRPR